MRTTKIATTKQKGMEYMGTKIASTMRSAAGWFRGQAWNLKGRMTDVLRSESGASHFVEILIGILLVVVVGALFLDQSRTLITNFFAHLWARILAVFV